MKFYKNPILDDFNRYFIACQNLLSTSYRQRKTIYKAEWPFFYNIQTTNYFLCNVTLRIYSLAEGHQPFAFLEETPEISS